MKPSATHIINPTNSPARDSLCHFALRKTCSPAGARTNTYIAFDTTDVLDMQSIHLSAFRELKSWQKNHPDRFNFINLEEIEFLSMHDDILEKEIRNHFMDIMRKADNVLVPASPMLNTKNMLLNWQISYAVNALRLPVTVFYIGPSKLEDKDIRAYWNWLPTKIRKYIGLDSARMAHIPMTRDKMERALNAFSRTKNTFPWDSTTIF